MSIATIIERMQGDPYYQDLAWCAFCRHPLSPQINREICAGNPEAAVLIKNTYAKIYRDMAIQEEAGISALTGLPDYLKPMA